MPSTDSSCKAKHATTHTVQIQCNGATHKEGLSSEWHTCSQHTANSKAPLHHGFHHGLLSELIILGSCQTRSSVESSFECGNPLLVRSILLLEVSNLLVVGSILIRILLLKVGNLPCEKGKKLFF